MSTGAFAELIMFLFLIAIIAGFIYLIYKLVLLSRKKLTEQFKVIGDKYGLELEKGDLKYYKINKETVLKGKIKGHDSVCSTYSIGRNDKTKVEWTEFTLQHNLGLEGYSLTLLNENILRKMGKGLGAVKEIEIGVQDFDKRFLIHSENLSTTRALLNENIREKLLNIPGNTYFGELLISTNEICYKVPRAFHYNETSKYFEKGIEVSLLILDELNKIYK
jgi:hypothetical protein